MGSCEQICPECSQSHRAEFPAAFTAPQAFGPRVQALVTYFHEVHHLPYGRLETMLGEVFHLDIAAGSLVNLVRRTGTALEPQAEAIRLEVVQSAVIGSDETGARVDGQNQWQWVFRHYNGGRDGQEAGPRCLRNFAGWHRSIPTC